MSEMPSLREIRKGMYSSLHHALLEFTNACKKEMLT